MASDKTPAAGSIVIDNEFVKEDSVVESIDSLKQQESVVESGGSNYTPVESTNTIIKEESVESVVESVGASQNYTPIDSLADGNDIVEEADI